MGSIIKGIAMSNLVSVRCKTCNQETVEDINRGDDDLIQIAKIVPYLKLAYDNYQGHYLQYPEVMGHGTEFITFMIDHYTHDLWTWSEYGEKDQRTRKIVMNLGH